MIKFLFLARRAPGLTRKAAQAHLRDVHGPMVVLPPADAGAMPAYYAQNHVIDGAYPAGDTPHGIERDLVTELQFDSMAAMQAAVTTPYYLENLRPDEPRFVHDPSVVRLNVVPRMIVSGPRTCAKLFILVSRTLDRDEQDWDTVRHHLVAAMQAWDGVVALTENAVAMPPQGPRFVDSVFEAWLDDHQAAMVAASQARRLLAIAGIDRDRSLILVAEELTEERLRGLLRERTEGPS